MGRPPKPILPVPLPEEPDYTPEQIALFKAELLDWVSKGGTLKAFCREPGKPDFRTYYLWAAKDPNFHTLLTHAREIGADAIAQETLDIADDARNDWMERLDKDGVPIGWMLNGEHVKRSQLRIDTRLKLLAVWHPAKYGNKVVHQGDPENPIQMLIQQVGGTALPVIEQGRLIEHEDDDPDE
jgi:hypothetical protein